jgi:hypothetical protein
MNLFIIFKYRRKKDMKHTYTPPKEFIVKNNRRIGSVDLQRGHVLIQFVKESFKEEEFAGYYKDKAPLAPGLKSNTYRFSIYSLLEAENKGDIIRLK